MGADEFCRYRVWLTVPVIDGIAHMGYHFIAVGLVNPEQRHVWQPVLAGSTDHRLLLDGCLPVAASYDDIGRETETVCHQFVEGFAVCFFPILLHILTDLQNNQVLSLANATEKNLC